jgi:hypothetical protein
MMKLITNQINFHQLDLRLYIIPHIYWHVDKRLFDNSNNYWIHHLPITCHYMIRIFKIIEDEIRLNEVNNK